MAVRINKKTQIYKRQVEKRRGKEVSRALDNDRRLGSAVKPVENAVSDCADGEDSEDQGEQSIKGKTRLWSSSVSKWRIWKRKGNGRQSIGWRRGRGAASGLKEKE
ncbi:putative acetylcholinesterase [Corchorus olitorius]|uniref:Acetylcholinesterase n=1 Tax=Corchorus olitorius TaxID=93759 RepID=A0A1R3KRU6_9ROSI|nr:putative acetylcholinesterase [Corchorus olitorius]